MRNLKIGVLLLVLAVNSELPGQSGTGLEDPFDYAELVVKSCGIDQELVNGTQFVNRYKRCLGHPYFLEDQLKDGSMTIRGNAYQDLLLKYDLVTQDLELEYTNDKGMKNRMIVIPDFIERFQYGPYQFEKLEFMESGMRYYQVIKTGRFVCYVHWYKNLVPVVNNIQYLEECSDANQIFWLDMDGKLNSFTNRRRFAALFPESSQKEIKGMLRRDMFRFRTASPKALTEMLIKVSGMAGKGDSS